jgi:uncharacterized protein (TIGR01244 family)
MVKSTLFGVALLLILGCSPAGEGQPPSSAEAEQVEGPLADLFEDVSMPPEIAALDIKNVHMLPSNLLTAGQLSEEQMTQLHQLGYRTFINLRMADERGTGWEEDYTEAAGITFHRLPVRGARGVTPKNAERLARLLEQAGDQPVVLYCLNGNRVGGLLALKAYHIDGLNIDEAVAYGVKAGMTRLEPVVRGRLTIE